MAPITQTTDSLAEEALELRNQGLPDNLIIDELSRRGYSMEEIQTALSLIDEQMEQAAPVQQRPSYAPAGDVAGEGALNITERIEEIAESIIDEKWDQLIAEVRKIIDWKNHIEEQQARLMNELEKLKDDFNTLHQGVLGKLEDYDSRMMDVGTELKAVGKVFKDVVPEFVENVKELSSLTAKVKGSRKE